MLDSEALVIAIDGVPGPQLESGGLSVSVANGRRQRPAPVARPS